MKLSNNPATESQGNSGQSSVSPSEPKQLWNLFRRAVLATLFGSAAIAVTKVTFFPASNQNTPLPFPEEVLLPEWQTKISPEKEASLSQPDADKLMGFVNGKTYQYRQGKQVLTIKMRYFSPSIGDVYAYLGHYKNKGISSSLVIREKKGMGSYGLFTQNQQAHLTTCLTPKGGSILKREQFLQVRYQSDIRPDRFLPWAIGKVPLLDNRCLWINMTLDGTNQNSPSSYYPILEKAWIPWNNYWRSHFEQFHP